MFLNFFASFILISDIIKLIFNIGLILNADLYQ